MTNAELRTVKIGEEGDGKLRTLCNQCRPAGGPYAY
jgi:hypothetical protein